MIFPWDEEASRVADWAIFLAKLFWTIVACEWAGDELRIKEKENNDAGSIPLSRDE